MKSHIVDDGHLDKLDIKVSPNRKVRMSKGLMAMEVPSHVLPFTPEDVEKCLIEFAKVSHQQLVDHCDKHNIDYDKWKQKATEKSPMLVKE